MKQLFLPLILLAALVIQSCEGPIGPQGPQGEPGDSFIGETFELEVSFNEANNYGESFDFTTPLFDGDVVLVYMNEESVFIEGRTAWRLVPQTFYFDEGVLVYNYDYTPQDFTIFMDISPIDLSSLDPYWTNNLLFRVVVLPSDLMNARMDFTDYEATMTHFGITEEDFSKK